MISTCCCYKINWPDKIYGQWSVGLSADMAYNNRHCRLALGGICMRDYDHIEIA